MDRYFFHATDERKKEPDYEGSDTESEDDDMDKTKAGEGSESEESDGDDSSWTKLSKDDTAATSAKIDRIRDIKADETETESEGGASLVDGDSDTLDESDEEPAASDSADRAGRVSRAPITLSHLDDPQDPDATIDVRRFSCAVDLADILRFRRMQ